MSIALEKKSNWASSQSLFGQNRLRIGKAVAMFQFAYNCIFSQHIVYLVQTNFLLHEILWLA